MVDRAIKDGHQVVTIPDNLKEKIHGQTDVNGDQIRDLGAYTTEWNKSFQFKFVKEADLTKQERAVFNQTTAILALIGGKPTAVKEILISETMRADALQFHEAAGLWESASGRIIIKRDQLKDLQSYAGTLLHEAAHARSGATDVTPEFEQELTQLLGTIAKGQL